MFFLCHGFTTVEAQRHVLAIASEQIGIGTTAATLRLQFQIVRHTWNANSFSLGENGIKIISEDDSCEGEGKRHLKVSTNMGD